MLTQQNITSLRIERQFLSYKANEVEYKALYRDTSPGQNVYWCGFGNPPSLTFRADFNDKKEHSQNYAGKEASLYKRAGRKNNKMSTGNEYKRLSILGADRTPYFKT